VARQGERVSVELSPEPRSVQQARRFVASTLGRWGLSEVVEDATLVVSELATNAAVHARTQYRLVPTRTLAGVQIDVLDRSPRRWLARPSDQDALGGRGLLLVGAIAWKWGATPQTALRGYAKGARHPELTLSSNASRWRGTRLSPGGKNLRQLIATSAIRPRPDEA
jgi:anti-sigma regulatory factor (Ser/Thr protein kinase)